jgi:hypothetical protein
MANEWLASKPNFLKSKEKTRGSANIPETWPSKYRVTVARREWLIIEAKKVNRNTLPKKCIQVLKISFVHENENKFMSFPVNIYKHKALLLYVYRTLFN